MRTCLVLFSVVLLAVTGCKNKVEKICQDALKEQTDSRDHTQTPMPDEEQKKFLEGCKKLSVDAARCTSITYYASHTPECAQYADQVNELTK